MTLRAGDESIHDNFLKLGITTLTKMVEKNIKNNKKHILGLQLGHLPTEKVQNSFDIFIENFSLLIEYFLK